jgi:polyhydroxyalkanoate synthesis regulator phasin
MAQNDMLKRYLDAGIAFTKMSRKRAEGIVNDLVKTGEVQREQAQERVEDLVDRSRRNTEALVELVRKELSTQLSSMGLATKADIARIEKRLSTLTGKPTTGPAASTPAPAKKAAAAPKKAPAVPRKAAKKAAPAKKAAKA